MENPVTLRTKKAMGVLGKLIREWTVDPASRPDHRLEEERRCVFYVDAFRNALNGEGLNEGQPESGDGDYCIRAGIEEVELILRQPNRFSILLPEAEMIHHLLDHDLPLQVRVAAVYAEVVPGDPDAVPIRPAIEDSGPANYEVTLRDQPFECFLDPYMAAYVCGQCR
ncbi:hypothetical protein [Pelagibius sp. Alg239-R121]|uniref:hypothetical protein n=1 Tax=Pelagibius sp. Alg239-R121 TaxID=2993448 RepID=UPI0024A6F724|nr:hypothetical protein [Pelagibius sp. Alg239-R121]